VIPARYRPTYCAGGQSLHTTITSTSSKSPHQVQPALPEDTQLQKHPALWAGPARLLGGATARGPEGWGLAPAAGLRLQHPTGRWLIGNSWPVIGRQTGTSLAMEVRGITMSPAEQSCPPVTVTSRAKQSRPPVTRPFLAIISNGTCLLLQAGPYNVA
jgi:hypothetical protein